MKRSSSKLLTFALVLSLATILLALPSCRSLDPNIAASAISAANVVSHSHDTIVIRDSIFVREYMAGDTIYRDRIQYRDRWHTQIVHDTVLKTDSIVEVIEHPPERYVPSFYKWTAAIFWTGIAILILYIILRTYFHF